MPVAKFQMPDGRIGRFEVPEGTTPEQAQGLITSYVSQSTPEPQKESGIGQDIGNLAAGALRGAGSIGATLLTPYDLIAGNTKSIGNPERRQAMDEGLQMMGAQPDSGLYKTGKIGGEIAGTAGVGGMLGKGVAALSQSPKAVQLAQALQSGGLSANGANMATRVGAGAATGAASAGLVDPDQAMTGAVIGGSLPAGVGAIKGLGSLGIKALGGTTGVGEEALLQALKSGKEGGKSGQSFASAMRGQSNMDDVLNSAKQNLSVMGQQKQEAYRKGMAGIKSDKAILNLDGVDDALKNGMSMATYKGQVKNEAAATALSKINSEVQKWKSLDPAEFHTPEGLDALKQRIGGMIEDIPYEQKTALNAANGVYNALKSEINKQAPDYAKVMKGYSEASETISEIEKALSLGKKASADTSMRKLQSLMRNNVNTSYGYRTKLAEQLQNAGGNEIMPALAGQSLNEFLPRGIQRATSGTGGAGLALTGNIPAAVGLAAVSSPRVVGEALYGAGKASAKVSPALIKALKKASTNLPVVGASINNE